MDFTHNTGKIDALRCRIPLLRNIFDEFPFSGLSEVGSVTLELFNDEYAPHSFMAALSAALLRRNH